jgi:hypothetical protein
MASLKFSGSQWILSWAMKLMVHLHLVPSLRVTGVITSTPLHNFMLCSLLITILTTIFFLQKINMNISNITHHIFSKVENVLNKISTKEWITHLIFNTLPTHHTCAFSRHLNQLDTTRTIVSFTFNNRHGLPVTSESWIIHVFNYLQIVVVFTDRWCAMLSCMDIIAVSLQHVLNSQGYCCIV